MDIDLTSSEKKSFFSFLALYLGSSFILMLIALFFYYQNEKTLYLDLVKSNMQNIVSKVSNEIINKVKGVNRVCYDISSKPPSTIEWE